VLSAAARLTPELSRRRITGRGSPQWSATWATRSRTETARCRSHRRTVEQSGSRPVGRKRHWGA
jgi:hypothetical protein